MSYADILGGWPNDEGLEHFAKRFFRAIGVQDFEERESSNYLEDRYFTGESRGTVFNVSLSDEVRHEDLPYWISIESTLLDSAGLQSVVNELVYNNLLPSGFRAAYMVNLGTYDEQRLDYRP